MKKTLRFGALVAACFLTAPASAAIVSIEDVDVGNGMAASLVLPVYAGTLNYWTGVQKLLIDGTQSALAFCVDPWEWTSSKTENYSTNNLNSIFGTAKAKMIGELYSEAYGSTLKPGSQGGNLNAAAFQLALWEIIADDNPAIVGLQSDLYGGQVHVVSGTNAKLITAANTLLSHIDGVYGSENYSFNLYTNVGSGGQAGYQDFLVANRIPEPSTASLMLGALSGLCGIGALGLGRPKKKA